MGNKKTSEKIMLIFNPQAGGKRNLLPGQKNYTIEEIKDLLHKYEINVDYYPTQNAEDAYTFAKKAVNKNYDMVIAAGGDGTTAEIASGLVNSNVTLAILPLGSVMNIAHMLGIDMDLEKAIQLIKINKTAKIDIGVIKDLGEETLVNNDCYYFFEEAGIGIEADLHYALTGIFERKEYLSFFKIIKTIFKQYNKDTQIYLDGKEMNTKATLIIVSNGPLGGAGFKMAPEAKLNDHLLTLSLFHMSKLDLVKHLLKIKNHTQKSRHIKTYQAQSIKIIPSSPQSIHADARIFGKTPVEFSIKPNSLKIITGFQEEKDSSLIKNNKK